MICEGAIAELGIATARIKPTVLALEVSLTQLELQQFEP
jgi:hypothetical protein